MSHFALQSTQVVVAGKMIAACVEIKDQLIHAIHAYGQELSCEVKDFCEQVIMP